MKKVQAKFKCISKQEFESHDTDAVAFTVKLQAVTQDSDENKQWSKYTPSGELEMHITNPAALPFFNVGKEYTMEFKPA